MLFASVCQSNVPRGMLTSLHVHPYRQTANQTDHNTILWCYFLTTSLKAMLTTDFIIHIIHATWQVLNMGFKGGKPLF